MGDSPIGLFDSGYGGLTVARAVLDQMPHESIAYFGDTARAPYGPRPIAQTRAFALEGLDRLVDHGVKALVIACNTASAAVLHDARERYDVPVVEVIRPAVRRAAAATRNHRVGVISTTGTHQSRAYPDAFAAAPHLEVTSVPCPRFVEFVEEGVTGGPELLGVAREYLAPLQERDVDTLVLGCTHYPLLTGVLSYVMGERVTLVSSAEETAKDLYRVLADADALRPDSLPPPRHGFTTTGDPVTFRRLARRFLGLGAELDDVFEAAPERPVPTGATAFAGGPR
ncbi:MAG TPA: glutamate racemase [Dermatophilaceae bacterium]|nr:glutamate racemase [Dermatophilaceae bacterium]